MLTVRKCFPFLENEVWFCLSDRWKEKTQISFGNEFLVNFVIEKGKNTKGVLCLLHISFPLSYFEHVSCWISQHFKAWHSLKCWQPDDSVEK
jgi:hypothetical protein